MVEAYSCHHWHSVMVAELVHMSCVFNTAHVCPACSWEERCSVLWAVHCHIHLVALLMMCLRVRLLIVVSKCGSWHASAMKNLLNCCSECVLSISYGPCGWDLGFHTIWRTLCHVTWMISKDIVGCWLGGCCWWWFDFSYLSSTHCTVVASQGYAVDCRVVGGYTLVQPVRGEKECIFGGVHVKGDLKARVVGCLLEIFVHFCLVLPKFWFAVGGCTWRSDWQFWVVVGMRGMHC